MPYGRRLELLHRHPEEIHNGNQNRHDFVVDEFADHEQDGCHELIGQFFVIAAGAGHLVVDDGDALFAVGVLARHQVLEGYLVENGEVPIAFIELLHSQFLHFLEGGQTAVLGQVITFAASAQRVLSGRQTFLPGRQFLLAAVEFFLDGVTVFWLDFDFVEGNDCRSVTLWRSGVKVKGGVVSRLALTRGEVVVRLWFLLLVIVCAKTGFVLWTFGSEIVGRSDFLAVPPLTAGMRIAWRQQHRSSQSLHPLHYFLGLVIVLPFDRFLLLLLQHRQCLQVALQFINLFLQILGLIKAMPVGCFLLELLQGPQLHDCFSVEVAEVGQHVAVLAAHEFLVDGCLFAVDQEGDQSHLVEDVDVVGVVLVEGEPQQQERTASKRDVAQLPRLVISVGAGLQGRVPQPHPAVLVVLLPLHLDLGADLVLVRQEGDVADLGQFQELDDDGLREGGEAAGLPPLGLCRLKHQFGNGVLWVFAGAVVYAEVYSTRLAFHQQTYC